MVLDGAATVCPSVNMTKHTPQPATPDVFTGAFTQQEPIPQEGI